MLQIQGKYKNHVISYLVVLLSPFPSLIGSLVKDRRHDAAIDILVVKYLPYSGQAFLPFKGPEVSLGTPL